MWDGAAAAARYLEAAAAGLAGKYSSVLELGSGTGLAGLAAAAALQLPTLLTDLPEVLPALRRNIAANAELAHLVTAAPLDWRQPRLPEAEANQQRSAGSSGGRLVLAADCVWLEELVPPFAAALELAVAARPGGRALLAYQSRSSRVDELLFGLLRRRFDVEAAAPLPGEPPRGCIDLFWLTPKGDPAEDGSGPQAWQGPLPTQAPTHFADDSHVTEV